jgi:hypothetical protein
MLAKETHAVQPISETKVRIAGGGGLLSRSPYHELKSRSSHAAITTIRCASQSCAPSEDWPKIREPADKKEKPDMGSGLFTHSPENKMRRQQNDLNRYHVPWRVTNAGDKPTRDCFRLFSVLFSAFENPGCNLLCFGGVILLRRELVGRPRSNPPTLLFGVAIAREKLIHFILKCHFFLRFLRFDFLDKDLRVQSKSSVRGYIGSNKEDLSHFHRKERLASQTCDRLSFSLPQGVGS